MVPFTNVPTHSDRRALTSFHPERQDNPSHLRIIFKYDSKQYLYRPQTNTHVVSSLFTLQMQHNPTLTTHLLHTFLTFSHLPTSTYTQLHINYCIPRYLSRYSDCLRAGRSGDRIPMGARFPAPVQTGPGAHPHSYTTGTRSFPGVKRQGRGVDHPLPSSAEV